MKAHGRFEGNLRLQVPGKVVAECGLRLSLILIEISLLKLEISLFKIEISLF